MNKILKISLSVLVVFFILLITLPIIFQNKISDIVKKSANDWIEGEVDYNGLKLSFFKHFPNLTISAEDIFLSGTEQFKTQPLLKAKELALGINVLSLFGDKIIIKKIFVEEGLLHVQLDSLGNANYDIYKSEDSDTTKSEGVEIRIAQINFNKIHLIYDDQSVPVLIDARNLNYTGKGDLASEVFDLHSKLTIQEMDLHFDGDQYFSSKKVDANLITSIDTKSLKFEFQRNDLRINQLPIRFKGLVSLIKNGYDIDFIIGTRDASLKELLSLLPKRFLPWLDNTNVSGSIGMFASLKGQYNSVQHTFPDAEFGFKISNGKLQNKSSKSALKDLELRFSAQMPKLDIESLHAKLDTLSFIVDQDHFFATAQVQGYSTPDIFAKVDAVLDLAKTQKALGIEAVDLKGKFKMDLHTEGKYISKNGENTLSSIEQIPNFDLKADLQDGYFKYADMPLGVEKIQLKLFSNTNTGQLKDITLDIPALQASAKENKINGKIHLKNAQHPFVDIQLKANVLLESLKDIVKIDSFQFKGNLMTDIQMKGIYNPETKNFPVSKADIHLKNGYLLTPYYQQPLENIQIISHLTALTDQFKDVQIDIEPISFELEQQPFILQADLKNLDNVQYNIQSNGIIELGKIYKIFALEGIDIDGKIITDLNLKGLQSDAIQGKYRNLDNKGTIELQNINVKLDEYPEAFKVEKGIFKIIQDQISLKNIQVKYASSDLALNGNFTNVTGYILEKDQKLKGHIDLFSNLLKVEDFLMYEVDTNFSIEENNTSSSVLLVPKDVQIRISPEVKKIDYMGSIVENLKANLLIDNGKAHLKDAQLEIAGAKAKMDIQYAPLSLQLADFGIKINAQEFDIQKVYEEVPLFKDLVSAAKYAKGTASMEYQLSGKIDETMSPIFPSLKGEGEIRIKNAQLMNFKLMNAVSKATEKDSLKNAEVKDVVIKTKIQNNIITLERTRLKIFGLRPRFEGQVSFDGDLNLKARLGLPPFGIIGIPFSVTGNSENPKIQLKRMKNPNTGLEEIVYERDEEENDGEDGEDNGVEQVNHNTTAIVTEEE